MRIVQTKSRLPVLLRNAIRGSIAALIMNSLLMQAAHGCNVTNVELHIGQTQQEAEEKTATNKTVCCTFYWLLTWDAGDATNPDFTVVWEYKSGSSWIEWLKTR